MQDEFTVSMDVHEFVVPSTAAVVWNQCGINSGMTFAARLCDGISSILVRKARDVAEAPTTLRSFFQDSRRNVCAGIARRAHHRAHGVHRLVQIGGLATNIICSIGGRQLESSPSLGSALFGSPGERKPSQCSGHESRASTPVIRAAQAARTFASTLFPRYLDIHDRIRTRIDGGVEDISICRCGGQ